MKHEIAQRQFTADAISMGRDQSEIIKDNSYWAPEVFPPGSTNLTTRAKKKLADFRTETNSLMNGKKKSALITEPFGTLLMKSNLAGNLFPTVT